MFRFSSQGASLDDLLQREWLCTNGVGGFASSTLACMNTRKYHGLLVAAMAPPVRRMVLLSRVEEVVTMDGWSTSLACNEYPGTVHPEGYRMLAAFRADPYPSWAYQADGWTIEKGLRLIEGENTVLLTYTMLGGSKPVTLEVRPLLAMRPIHELMYQWNGRLVTEHKSKRHYRVAPTMRTPEVFFAHDGAYTDQAYWYLNTIYRREQDRGYSGLEDLWSPGAVKWTIGPGQTAHFVCSAEPIDLERVLRKAEQTK
jgi:predicted glycogen debranching enzyme